jgi:hypothetical protein
LAIQYFRFGKVSIIEFKRDILKICLHKQAQEREKKHAGWVAHSAAR